MIRISGGKYRSRKLETPETTLTKPTMDKVRAGIFNALGNDLSNKKVLDLFAGSGSYGFESLSRNATYVTFVDQTIYSRKAVEQNAKNLGINEYEFIQSDVLSFLKNCDKTYDVISLDPPYKLDIVHNVLELISSKHLLNANGIIIVESEKELTFPNETCREIRSYHYSLAHVYLLKY